MPPELDRLLAELLGSIADHNTAIAAGRISVDDWALLVARDLLAGHYAGYMLGRGTKDIGPQSREMVGAIVGGQLDYLNNFADAIRADGWRDAFGARAALYVGAMKETFWRGRSFGLDLPYYPTQTICLGNCKCRWDITWLDEENLDADCMWVRGADDSCATCIDRAGVVVKFRGGERI